MADKKATGNASKKAAGAKAKKASAKPAAKRAAPKKAAAKKAAPKASAKRAAPKRAASSNATSGLDKSVAQFRESLEQSVSLNRDRIQEVVDDAVKRGRMTRGDAEKLFSDLVNRGRKQTDALLKEL